MEMYFIDLFLPFFSPQLLLYVQSGSGLPCVQGNMCKHSKERHVMMKPTCGTKSFYYNIHFYKYKFGSHSKCVYGGEKSRRSDQDCETEEKKYNAALQGNSFSTFSCTFWKSNFNKFEMSGHSA